MRSRKCSANREKEGACVTSFERGRQLESRTTGNMKSERGYSQLMCCLGTHTRSHPYSHGVAHLRPRSFRGNKDCLRAISPNSGDFHAAHFHLPGKLIDHLGISSSLDTNSFCVSLRGKSCSFSLSCCFYFQTLSLCFGGGNDAVGLRICLSVV